MAQVQLLLSRGARVSSEHTRLAQRAPELRRRSGAGVWRRCADTVAELLQGERRRRARRRWRAALLAVSLLPGWHARAALRVGRGSEWIGGGEWPSGDLLVSNCSSVMRPCS